MRCLLLIIIAFGFSCNEPLSHYQSVVSSDFMEYWNDGNAEITTYEVTQERYGAHRKGEQVSIFVTEPFSRLKQVKIDRYECRNPNHQAVLKLNTIRRFKTGIYDYSVMQSVFSPLDASPALKSTTTIQDWCGQVFAQCNRKAGGYQIQAYSYFEADGDWKSMVQAEFTEDALWSAIRINPDFRSSAVVMMLPSVAFLQLEHVTFEPQKAHIELVKDSLVSNLVLTYEQLPRRVVVQFETNFPHRILGWTEVYRGKLLSEGKIKKSRKSRYWEEHDISHALFRDSLDLSF
jgi:hypothetical protein